MAPLNSFLFVLLSAFLLICSHKISGQDLPSRLNPFVQEPEAKYYVKKEPATIVCKARNVAEITFICVGTQIPASSLESETSPELPNITEVSVRVKKDDVLNFSKNKPNEQFWCQCQALDERGEVVAESRKGEVSVIYLNPKFEVQPSNVVAFEGDSVEIVCGPPKGNPKPEIIWRKNTKRIKPSSRLVIADSGSLVIYNVKPEDAGNYQCVALNSFGRYESKSAILSVVDNLSIAGALLEHTQSEEYSQEEEGKTRIPRQSRSKTLSFSMEPKDAYYITPDKEVTILCGTIGADVLTFVCNRERITNLPPPQTGFNDAKEKLVQNELTLNYSYVISRRTAVSKKNEVMQCSCMGHRMDPNTNTWVVNIASNEQLGFIYVPYLDRNFNAEPSDVVAALNSKVVLKCEAPNGVPKPHVYWYKDDDKVELRSDRYSIDPRGSLTILSVEQSDSGRYYCTASNSFETVESRTARLRVDAAQKTTTAPKPAVTEEEDLVFPDVFPDTPQMTKYPELTQEIEDGGELKLSCAGVHFTRISVDCENFRMDPATDKELKSGQVPYNKVMFRLVVNPKNTDQKLGYAEWKLKASNLTKPDFKCQCIGWYVVNKKYSRVFGQQIVYNLKSDSPPTQEPLEPYLETKFELSPRGQKVYLNEEVALRCAPPKGYPKPKITWKKDQVAIDFSDSNHVLTENGTLIIARMRVEDAGSYICVAKNIAGSTETRPVRLILADRTTTTTTTTTETPEITTIMNDPIFVQDLDREYTVTEDMTADLICSAVHTNLLVFYCNKEMVKNSHRSMTSLDVEGEPLRENRLIFTADQIASVGGTYRCHCRAYFKHGSNQFKDGVTAVIRNYQELEETIVPVVVTALPESEPKPEPEGSSIKPYISKDLFSHYYLVENRPTTVTCEAINVRSITFECDGQEVPDRETQKAEENQGGFVTVVTSTIELTKSEQKEEEAYTCFCKAQYLDEATNSMKELTSTPGYVDVATLKREFEQEPDDQTVNAGEFLSLQCTPPVGNPAPKVYWTKNSQRLEGATIINGNLILGETSVESEGDYICHAENEAGKRSSRVAVVTVSAQTPGVEDITTPVPEGQTGTEIQTGGDVSCTKEIQECLEKSSCRELPMFEQCIQAIPARCRFENEELKAELDESVSQRRTDCQSVCPKLNNCASITANEPTISQNNGVIDLKEICNNQKEYVMCVDEEMDKCNIENNTSLQVPLDILTNFCYMVNFEDSSVSGCDGLRRCEIDLPTGTVKTVQWCGLAAQVTGCLEKSVESCRLADAEMNLEKWRKSFNVCADVYPALIPMSKPDGDPEPTPEKELQTKGEPTGETNEEEEEEASQGAASDDSSSLSRQEASFLLAVILQIALAVCVSWR